MCIRDSLETLGDGQRDGFLVSSTAPDRARVFTAVPVVLMTADNHLAEKTATIGAAGALGKPFDIDELLRVVRRFAG